MFGWLPGLQAFRSYRRKWLARDIIAGVVLTTLLVVFAELKDPVREKIERYGLTRTIDPHYFFPTIGAAIAAYRDQTGAQWTADQPTADQAAAGRTDPAKTATDTG